MRHMNILSASILLGLTGCASDQTTTGPSEMEASFQSATGVGMIRGGKVAVCQRTRPGRFVRIEVAAPAVKAHRAHGDELAGGAVLNKACRPNATVRSLVAVVDGIVRDGNQVLDGSIVQALHVPSMEDRGIIEFNISSLPRSISSAKLKLVVYASMGPYPFAIGAFAYAGDGVLSSDDWDSGAPFTSFRYAGEARVTLDVTRVLQGLVASGADIAGFNFRFSVPSPIPLNGPFLAFRSIEYGPAAVLEVTGKGHR
jgi:hypothetical protein